MMRALALPILLFAALAAALPTATVSADDASKSEGFVQLFNGKDLTGWKPHPADTGTKWEVVDGAITASGEKAGHLFSERGDYTDFVYRMEAKINDVGNSGQYFRAKFEKGFPPGYEAQINFGHRDPIKTGSLYPAFNRRLRGEQRDKLLVKKAPHGAEEWFTQEVTAVGNHITIKVNGQQTVDFVDDSNAFTKGHFAIQYHDPTCKIRVRKVEVKELKSGDK